MVTKFTTVNKNYTCANKIGIKICTLIHYMKTIFALLPLLLTCTKSCIITPKKLCRDCKHFIPRNTCSKFGTTDLVTGDNEYMYASTARISNKHCGPDAEQFEENKNKVLIVPYYFVKKQWPNILLATLCITYFNVLLK
uniref:Uncharacterized protein n=1 Tax=viral metagenome TaxID=1070528 RepID=A0A6C0I480_9ZZZZ